jgi:predicted choloylglycine hydrolase
VAVSRERSAGNTPLLARNFDFPALGVAQHYGLVVVYHPNGKRAFASITHPGVIGTHSFLNEDGLTGAVMEVHGGANRFSAEAMPALMLYRSIAESTDRVDEGLALLKGSPRPSSNNLMLVEASGLAAVAEFTVKDFAVRRPENGLLFSTNHHRSKEFGFRKSVCPRMHYLLEQAANPDAVWSVETLKTHLKKTALGRLNLYSIVFLPEKRCFHLAAGHIPAANEPFVVLDQKTLFEPTLRRLWL